MKEARVEFSELKFAQYSKLKLGDYLMLVFFVAEERQHSFYDAYTSKNSQIYFYCVVDLFGCFLSVSRNPAKLMASPALEQCATNDEGVYLINLSILLLRSPGGLSHHMLKQRTSKHTLLFRSQS